MKPKSRIRAVLRTGELEAALQAALDALARADWYDMGAAGRASLRKLYFQTIVHGLKGFDRQRLARRARNKTKPEDMVAAMERLVEVLRNGRDFGLLYEDKRLFAMLRKIILTAPSVFCK